MEKISMMKKINEEDTKKINEEGKKKTNKEKKEEYAQALSDFHHDHMHGHTVVQFT